MGFNLAIEILLFSGQENPLLGHELILVSISQSRYFSFQAMQNRHSLALLWTSSFNLAIEILLFSGKYLHLHTPNNKQAGFNLAIEILLFSGKGLPEGLAAVEYCFNLAIEILLFSGETMLTYEQRKLKCFNLAIEILLFSGST